VRSGTLGDIDGDDDELAVVDIDEPRDDVCEVVRVTDFVFVDVCVDVRDMLRVSEGVRVRVLGFGSGLLLCVKVPVTLCVADRLLLGVRVEVRVNVAL